MRSSVMDRILLTRHELVDQLRCGDAHQSFLDAVAEFPDEAINLCPVNVAYSFWNLVEHVRYCQRDMFDYLRAADYQAGTFPVGYWPSLGESASAQQFADSIASFANDLDEIESFLLDADVDLWQPAPWAWEPNHHPLRTVMVMIDHNSYHAGELGILRQVMGLWPERRVDGFHAHAVDTQSQ
jgi:hypothetical protein